MLTPQFKGTGEPRSQVVRLLDRRTGELSEGTGEPEEVLKNKKFSQLLELGDADDFMPVRLFGCAEAADLAGVSERAIQKAVTAGKLQAIPVEVTSGRRKGRLDWGIPAEALFAAYPQARAAYESQEAERRAGIAAMDALIASHEAQHQAKLKARKARRGTPVETRTERATSRAFVLGRLDQYLGAKGLRLKVGLVQFAQAFNGRSDPWLEAQIPGWVRAQIEDVSPRSLERWRSDYKAFGIQGLEDRYGNRKGCGHLDQHPEQREALLGLMLDKPHLSARLVAETLRTRFLKDSPSYSQVLTFMNTWKRENRSEFQLATNPDAWKNSSQVAFGSRSEGVGEYLNQLWELDATKADLILEDGRRYALCTVIDVFSRRTLFLVSDQPRGTAHAELMRRAITAWGLPEAIKTDNGKDYVSGYMSRVVSDLEISQTLCQPFSGEQKPHVERVQQTFNHDLVTMLPGFTGHNVSQAQALRAQKTFAERLFKEGTVEVGLSKAAFEGFIEKWTLAYEHKAHAGLAGKTPAQVVAEWTEKYQVRRVKDLVALDYLLAEGATKTIQKKGIRHENRYYIAPELAPHVGVQVEIRLSPENAGRVAVFLRGEFLCIAEDPAMTGTSRQEIATLALAAQKARKAALKTVHRSLKRQLKPSTLVAEILDQRLGGVDPVAPLQLPDFVEPTALAASAAAHAAEQLAAQAAKTEPQALTAEEQAAADRMWAEYESTQATPDRPVFGDDLEAWGRWYVANKDKATPGDHAEWDRLTQHAGFRWLMGIETA